MVSALRMVERRCAITKQVRPRISSFIASWILISVRESTFDVASSRISISELERNARAMVISCFCPLDMFTPSSDMTVSYPSGRLSIKLSIRAALAAARTSSKVASSLP